MKKKMRLLIMVLILLGSLPLSANGRPYKALGIWTWEFIGQIHMFYLAEDENGLYIVQEFPDGSFYRPPVKVEKGGNIRFVVTNSPAGDFYTCQILIFF